MKPQSSRQTKLDVIAQQYDVTFRRWVAFTIAWLLVAVGHSAQAADYSSKTHFYMIEYLKPTTGDLTLLNIVLSRQLDAQAVERILREELQRAVLLFPPKGEVMASAWSETGARGSDRRIALPDGSNFLIYLPTNKQIQTEKQYDISLQKPPQPGKGLNVELLVEIERGRNGHARILGKTNLPHGMALMLSLRDTASKYFGQAKVEVQDGQFVSSWFSDEGKPLRAGTYRIGVSSPLPDLQPAAVRARIGEKGENLSGPIGSWMGSKMVKYETTKALK